MNKRGFFTGIIVIIVLLVVGFFWFIGQRTGDDIIGDKVDELINDSVGDFVNESDGEGGGKRCVPASCCHANECVWESEAPDCSGSFCSLSCEPDTMDCGAGQCGVVDGECEVIWDE